MDLPLEELPPTRTTRTGNPDYCQGGESPSIASLTSTDTTWSPVSEDDDYCSPEEDLTNKSYYSVEYNRDLLNQELPNEAYDTEIIQQLQAV